MNMPSQPLKPGWSDARIARLVELWRARLSASQIAHELGGGLTRSAVVGKLFRMGLGQDAAERYAARVDGARQSRLKRPRAAASQPVRPQTPQTLRGGPMTPLLAGIVELGPSSCRWPYPMEGETRFCGHPRKSASPYCPDHHRRAYDALLPALTMEQIENIARRAS